MDSIWVSWEEALNILGFSSRQLREACVHGLPIYNKRESARFYSDKFLHSETTIIYPSYLEWILDFDHGTESLLPQEMVIKSSFPQQDPVIISPVFDGNAYRYITHLGELTILPKTGLWVFQRKPLIPRLHSLQWYGYLKKKSEIDLIFDQEEFVDRGFDSSRYTDAQKKEANRYVIPFMQESEELSMSVKCIIVGKNTEALLRYGMLEIYLNALPGMDEYIKRPYPWRELTDCVAMSFLANNGKIFPVIGRHDLEEAFKKHNKNWASCLAGISPVEEFETIYEEESSTNHTVIATKLPYCPGFISRCLPYHSMHKDLEKQVQYAFRKEDLQKFIKKCKRTIFFLKHGRKRTQQEIEKDYILHEKKYTALLNSIGNDLSFKAINNPLTDETKIKLCKFIFMLEDMSHSLPHKQQKNLKIVIMKLKGVSHSDVLKSLADSGESVSLKNKTRITNNCASLSSYLQEHFEQIPKLPTDYAEYAADPNTYFSLLDI